MVGLRNWPQCGGESYLAARNTALISTNRHSRCKARPVFPGSGLLVWRSLTYDLVAPHKGVKKNVAVQQNKKIVCNSGSGLTGG
jgi:hypothetical protein